MSDTSTHDADGRDTRWAGHRAARHELILRTAIAAIERDGRGVRVAAIADEAGIPRSVVYRLFRDRSDLDDQIRARITGDLLATLAPALAPDTRVRDAIDLATRAYVDWVAAHPQLYRFVGSGSESSPAPGVRTVLDSKAAFADDVAALIEAHVRSSGSSEVPEGASQNLAFGIVGLVDMAVNRWVAKPEGRSSTDELASFLAGAVWNVLSTTAKGYGIKVDGRTRVGTLG